MDEIGRIGDGTIVGISIRPDEAGVVVLGSLGLWIFDRALQEVLFRPVESRISAITWHPQGSMLTIGTSDGTVELWDLVASAVIATVRAHRGPITQIGRAHV